MRSKTKVSDEIFNKKNVVVHSDYTHDKDGDEVVQIYVVQKEPESQLADCDMVEKEIEGIKTKVIDLGSEPSIFSGIEEGHRGFVNELTPGCSIGNYEVTAGTLGWFMKKGRYEYLTSNAHIFADYPHRNVAIEGRIAQPGIRDGGNRTVAIYESHYALKPTVPILDYPLNWWEQFKLKRGWLKEPVVPENWKTPINHVDFATAKRLDDIVPKYETMDFPVSYNYDLAGRILAGTMYTSLFVKVGYELDLGYTPAYVDVADVKKFDKVRKSGRTTGDTEMAVMDDSCTMIINYGYFKAKFEDLSLTMKMSAGGDSGSSIWKKKDLTV